MSSSSSSMKICFNPTCEDSTTTSSERFRKGWRLRNGDLVDLCDRCASAYEDGRFCETCHKDATGWRNCEACRKPLHCGCIVSIPAFVLLDAGGVACNACAGKNVVIASNQRWPSSLFMALHVPETLQDFSVKNWSTIAGANVIGGQRVQPPNIQDTTTVQPEFHRRVPSEIDRSNHSKLADTERPTTSVQEKIEKEDPLKRVSCSSLGLSAIDRLGNGKGAVSIGAALSTCHKDEGGKDGLQSSHPPLSENMELKKGVFAQSKSCVNVLLDSSTSKDDPSTPHFGLIAPYTLQDETSSIRVSGAQSVRQTPPPTFANGKDSSGVTQVPNGKMRLDAWGRNLLPRYWPKITDQELQHSNSAFTPLFEKVLSASDAGRIGRLVLPKKCAEAYFPAIYNPEGVPIEVQDVKGTLWTFQYRFWPNNKSRMYVLEGVTNCIQSMQLQAGDTVTFSRVDPQGKLVIGGRKASSDVQPSNRENKTPQTWSPFSTNAGIDNRKVTVSEDVSTPLRPLQESGESTSYSSMNHINLTDPASSWAKAVKPGGKNEYGDKFARKRKISTLGSKSKSLQTDIEDIIEIKITWEEAQGLLRPPPEYAPNIMFFDGHEFEESEEAPIVGKPAIFATNELSEKIQLVQCEDCSKWRKIPFDTLLPSRWTCFSNLWDQKRSSCSSEQELNAEQLHSLLSFSNTVASKKTKADEKKSGHAVEALEGLDTLANLAILEEGETPSTSCQVTTTRHPRHKPGCTCIVCIQPPSGKGPKHSDSCMCNICLTVRRRLSTQMERRVKRKLEKEAEKIRKEQEQEPETPEQEENNPSYITGPNPVPDDDDCNRKNTSSPPKGCIDLNIQPDREEERSPVLPTS